MAIPIGKIIGNYYKTYLYSDGTRIVIDKGTDKSVVRWFPEHKQWISKKGDNPFDNPNDDALLELMQITSIEPAIPTIEEQCYVLDRYLKHGPVDWNLDNINNED